MPQLLFKREFFEAIRNGRKTTTLRRWKSCKLAAGDSVTCRGIGQLKVKTCQQIDPRKLTEADAVADGFASLRELRETINRIYPDQKTDGKQWYRVVFTLETIESSPQTIQKRPKKPGKSMKPTPPEDKARLARRIRAELDKAVQRNGLLSPI